MADVDPLGILNSELKPREDGVKRRANEQVVRQYMNFGNWRKSGFVVERCVVINIQGEEEEIEIRRVENSD